MSYYDTEGDPRTEFLATSSPKWLLTLNVVFALTYFFILAFFFPVGNEALFALLIAGEVFHLWLVMTFIATVWDTAYEPLSDPSFAPPVDVFITVAGEPVDIVEKTARAALAMRYKHFGVHILNDGLVAKKDNWRDIEALARKLGVHCITRTVQGGAKAGNINNALKVTGNPLIAMFDADHVPHSDFLEKTVPYFADSRVGFVQTPQFYKNYGANYLTRSSWEQQELFFGAICRGKNRLNSATMCGTNMVISRQALGAVGGMCADSIAEDFVTGLFMHEKGYRSVYVPEVLAEGLATEDLLSYTKQQYRWARGALDVIFRYNPLLRPGLSWAQKIQYLSSASFFLSGVVVALDMMLPIIFFFTGQVPVRVDGMLLAAVFLPYMFFTLYSIQRVSNFTFTFPSLGFSIGAFNIHMRAFFSALTGERAAFNITEKQRQRGNFLPLVKWHLAYIALAVCGVGFALAREGVSAALINNLAWAVFNCAVFVPVIRAALPQGEAHEPVSEPQKETLHHDAIRRR